MYWVLGSQQARVCVCVLQTQYTRTSRQRRTGPHKSHTHAHTCLLTTEDRLARTDLRRQTHTHACFQTTEDRSSHTHTCLLTSEDRSSQVTHTRTSFLLRDLRLASAASYTAGVLDSAGIQTHVLADYRGPSSDVRHTHTHVLPDYRGPVLTSHTHTHTHTCLLTTDYRGPVLS